MGESLGSVNFTVQYTQPHWKFGCIKSRILRDKTMDDKFSIEMLLSKPNVQL